MTDHYRTIEQITAIRDELVDSLDERQCVLFEEISKYSLESLKIMSNLHEKTRIEIKDLMDTLREMGIKV